MLLKMKKMISFFFSIALFLILIYSLVFKLEEHRLNQFYASHGFMGQVKLESISLMKEDDKKQLSGEMENLFLFWVKGTYQEEVAGQKVEVPLKIHRDLGHLLLAINVEETFIKEDEDLDLTIQLIRPLLYKAIELNPDFQNHYRTIRQTMDKSSDFKNASLHWRTTYDSDSTRDYMYLGSHFKNQFLENQPLGGLLLIPIDEWEKRTIVYSIELASFDPDQRLHYDERLKDFLKEHEKDLPRNGYYYLERTNRGHQLSNHKFVK